MSEILKADRESIERDKDALSNPLDFKNQRRSSPAKKPEGSGRHSIIN
jgi:hypothetical protein